MCGIMDFDTVLFVPNFLVEIRGKAIAIGDQAFQGRNALF
jgi:hypothetical protein